MNILLDTHVAYWCLYAPSNLPDNIRKMLDDENNDLYVSAISVWEIGHKHLKKEKEMPTSGSEFYDDLRFNDFYLMPVKAKHIVEYEKLKIKENMFVNKDPFDRMLVAQAKHERFKLLTHDDVMQYYNEGCIEYF